MRKSFIVGEDSYVVDTGWFTDQQITYVYLNPDTEHAIEMRFFEKGESYTIPPLSPSARVAISDKVAIAIGLASLVSLEGMSRSVRLSTISSAFFPWVKVRIGICDFLLNLNSILKKDKPEYIPSFEVLFTAKKIEDFELEFDEVLQNKLPTIVLEILREMTSVIYDGMMSSYREPLLEWANQNGKKEP